MRRLGYAPPTVAPPPDSANTYNIIYFSCIQNPLIPQIQRPFCLASGRKHPPPLTMVSVYKAAPGAFLAHIISNRLLFEMNVTKVICKDVLVKSSGKTLFFTCILPDYVVHESSKEF